MELKDRGLEVHLRLQAEQQEYLERKVLEATALTQSAADEEAVAVVNPPESDSA